MSPTEDTLTQISRLISFNSDDVSLKNDILNNKLNWDNIVKIGSKHLIIPTIFIRLKSKKLLTYLPKDLQAYLKYIYDLNEERNLALLKEVTLINAWFNAENIEHVFLKGAAMIASNYYEAIGERMLGDIDVIVPKNQSEKAFQLLIEKGYSFAKEPKINPKYFEDKHLLRLASKNYIGAVEIHFKLLDKEQKDLKPKDVLKDKQFVEESNIPIPSVKHLILHNILNFQINDLGSYYNFIGLKNSFDTLVLWPRLPKVKHKQILQNKHVRNNLNLGSIYFKDLPKLNKSLRLRYHAKMYQLKNESNTFNFWHYKTLAYLDLSKLILHRTWFFIINKNYRKDILNDQERIKAFIKSKL